MAWELRPPVALHDCISASRLEKAVVLRDTAVLDFISNTCNETQQILQLQRWKNNC